MPRLLLALSKTKAVATRNPNLEIRSSKHARIRAETRNPKSEVRNNFLIGKFRKGFRLGSSMTEGQGDKRYDLEDRTFAFAKRVRAFVKDLAKTIGNIEDARQVIRASGSVGANYIEANEALSKKDFVLRIKICRKEAKESGYFLRLIDANSTLLGERDNLVQEASELVNIFGAIVRKTE
jgi:four helix bundle protein